MRTLASIQVVESVTEILGADKIEVVNIVGMGWQVVVGKGEFAAGDKVVFFEIDSALPTTDSRYDFLKERCTRRWKRGDEVLDSVYRIKTIKLRGVFSQGLVMPIWLFPELWYDTAVGDDVTEKLGVRHFDEVSEYWSIVCGRGASLESKGGFPSSWCPKTDEPRIQGCMKFFSMYKDLEFEATEKFDGSSMTVVYAPIARPEDPFFLCSRNMEKKYAEGSEWWKVVERVGLKEKMERHCADTGQQLAIQGELVGPGFNGNRDRYLESHWKVFRIWDVKKQEFLLPGERYAICEKFGLEHVKVLHKNWKVFQELDTLAKMLKYVEGKTDNGFEREGVVWKAVTDGRISFKCINNNYLLKEKDEEVQYE